VRYKSGSTFSRPSYPFFGVEGSNSNRVKQMAQAASVDGDYVFNCLNYSVVFQTHCDKSINTKVFCRWMAFVIMRRHSGIKSSMLVIAL